MQLRPHSLHLSPILPQTETPFLCILIWNCDCLLSCTPMVMWSEFEKLKWWTSKWGKRSYHSWLATPRSSLTYTRSYSSLWLHHVKQAPLKPMSLNLQSYSTSRKFAICHSLLGSPPYFSFIESVSLKLPMHIHGNVTCWWSRRIKFHVSIHFNFSGWVTGLFGHKENER